MKITYFDLESRKQALITEMKDQQVEIDFWMNEREKLAEQRRVLQEVLANLEKRNEH